MFPIASYFVTIFLYKSNYDVIGGIWKGISERRCSEILKFRGWMRPY